MRHTRLIALATSIVIVIAGLAGTAFALTNEEATPSAVKAGRTSKQAPAALLRYEAAQEKARQASETAAFMKALDERNRFLAGVAAQQKAEAEAAQARKERAAVLARQRASRAATTSRGAAYGPWADLINQYPWPTQTAYRIMMCESGGNANAYNARSGATGLFQILNGPFDPAANVAMAFRMWQQRGWQPWTCA
ncbi:MAG TPA: transglycosylase SLT domain-containing protein [Acidimicrobiales bacterium]|nr:transglycosylase SLT domain-containing protein [Acidimicrobiales bacterium]